MKLPEDLSIVKACTEIVALSVYKFPTAGHDSVLTKIGAELSL
jgi:hypothetical protein